MQVMLKLLFLLCIVVSPLSLLAQQDSIPSLSNSTDSIKTISDPEKNKNNALKGSIWPIWELQRRANDHIMVQFGYFTWLNQPSGVKAKGMPNTVNIYAMYDFAFRSNPHFSVALGFGVTWNNLYFASSSKVIDYTNTTSRTDPFSDLSETNHFKKNSMTQFYINVPAIEFRYVSNAKNTNKAFKASIGASYGWLLFNQTIGKELLDANGNTVNSIKQKFVSNQFFATGRILVTARVGWGPVSAFISYQPTSIFTSTGPNVQALSVGISLGGL